jgi:short-subunit dehydrogenase
MNFRDQAVWITGASSGIGAAVARELARRGARLVLSARREGELHRVRESCERPGRHLVFPLDVSDADPLGAAVDDVRARFGDIDVLVHSSGVSQRELAERTALAVDRRLMEINFFAAVALTKALLPTMLARGQGHLVPISSVAGKLGTPARTAYCASKHALHGFFDGLRAEVEDRGIRVTLVTPGYVRTAVAENALTGEGRAFGTTDSNIANGLSPEECAIAIARGVERGDREVLVGGTETLGVYVKRFFPGLAARIVKRLHTPTSPAR